MAWNEPGGNGKKENPWGNKKNDSNNNGDGPPDLDQILKNFIDK